MLGMVDGGHAEVFEAMLTPILGGSVFLHWRDFGNGGGAEIEN